MIVVPLHIKEEVFPLNIREEGSSPSSYNNLVR